MSRRRPGYQPLAAPRHRQQPGRQRGRTALDCRGAHPSLVSRCHQPDHRYRLRLALPEQHRYLWLGGPGGLEYRDRRNHRRGVTRIPRLWPRGHEGVDRLPAVLPSLYRSGYHFRPDRRPRFEPPLPPLRACQGPIAYRRRWRRYLSNRAGCERQAPHRRQLPGGRQRHQPFCGRSDYLQETVCRAHPAAVFSRRTGKTGLPYRRRPSRSRSCQGPHRQVQRNSARRPDSGRGLAGDGARCEAGRVLDRFSILGPDSDATRSQRV